jgi:hypothetical protein
MDKNESTHLFMSGGKLKLSDNDVELFWKHYINCVNSKISVSLVERSNSILMRFFLDIDIKDPSCLFDVDDFMRKEREVMKYSDYVICTRQVGNKILGVHVVYQNVTYTTVDEAKTLVKLFSIIEGVDSSVYSTGLRVIGSVKPGQSVERKHVYLPILRVTNNVIHHIESCVTPNTLMLTNIRLSHTNRAPVSKSIMFSTTRDKMSSDDCMIPETSLIHPEYDNCITDVTHYIDDYFIANSCSKYCTNINREHNSASVYFVINVRSKQMYQKCFCKCQNKTCKTYKSKSVAISNSTRNMILQTKQKD